ncbi:MAG: phospho-N-acetylmuramoyl-pentapeptide-transferase [Limisphaerales bacterium]
MIAPLTQELLTAYEGTPLGDALSPLRVFQYITFRSAGAAVTALLLSLWLGPPFIRWLLRLKFGQDYQDLAARFMKPGERGGKVGIPTMGGLLIVTAIDVSVLFWARWNPLVVLTLVSLVGLAGLGFYDDWVKLTREKQEERGRGITPRVKLVIQFLLAAFIAVYLWLQPATNRLIADVMLPFMKSPLVVGSGVVGISVAVLAIVGSSNAVNLTDGLDGLAIGCTVIVTAVFFVLTYVAGNAVFAGYLQVSHVPGAGELSVVCAAMFGASLGFLWFNCYPAQVFMGDTGSLALGGVLGIMAVLIHQPFILIVAGGVFVMEAGSVVLQVASSKLSRRFLGRDIRPFLMSPIHHHFEKLGWPENKVVVRFYVLGVLFAVLALATLKLR